MKLTVLGATGGTGLRIVELAVQSGHTITAFVPSPERLGNLRSSIAVRQGDLLGASEEDLFSRPVRALRAAIEGSGVRRAVVESTAFLFRDAILPRAYLVGRLFSPRL